MQPLLKRLSGGILDLFLPVSKENKAAFRDYIMEDTFNKSCAIHIFALFMHFITVFFALSLIIGGSDIRFFRLDWAYFFITLAVSVLSAVTVIFILKFRKSRLHQKKLDNLVLCSAVLLMIMIGFITSYEFFVAGQYFHYILFCIIFSLLVSCSLLQGLLILLPGYLSFFISHTLLSQHNPQAYTELSADAMDVLKSAPINANLAAYIILCVFIFAINNRKNYLNFLSTQRIMAYQKELEELTQRLNSANEQLRAISVIDALTKLNNRRALDEYLADIWPKCQADNAILSIMMFDADFFKSYNDNFGHQAGDEVLRLIADVIKRNFSRIGGMLARYGGEEFIAVIPYVEENTIRSTAERIRAQVEALGIANPTASNKDNLLTVSIGVLITNAKEAESMEECIRFADEALYRAKSQGRNTIVTDIPCNLRGGI